MSKSFSIYIKSIISSKRRNKTAIIASHCVIYKTFFLKLIIHDLFSTKNHDIIIDLLKIT